MVIDKIIFHQQATFKKVFKKYPHDFHQPNHHYDWWIFPVKISSKIQVSKKTREFAISDKETELLLKDQKFIKTYLQSIELYINNLEQFGWNNYDVRFAKMLQSLKQFISISQDKKEFSLIHKKISKLKLTAQLFAQKNIKNPSSFLKLSLQELKSENSGVSKIPRQGLIQLLTLSLIFSMLIIALPLNSWIIPIASGIFIFVSLILLYSSIYKKMKDSNIHHTAKIVTDPIVENGINFKKGMSLIFSSVFPYQAFQSSIKDTSKIMIPQKEISLLETYLTKSRV